MSLRKAQEELTHRADLSSHSPCGVAGVPSSQSPSPAPLPAHVQAAAKSRCEMCPDVQIQLLCLSLPIL